MLGFDKDDHRNLALTGMMIAGGLLLGQSWLLLLAALWFIFTVLVK